MPGFCLAVQPRKKTYVDFSLWAPMATSLHAIIVDAFGSIADYAAACSWIDQADLRCPSPPVSLPLLPSPASCRQSAAASPSSCNLLLFLEGLRLPLLTKRCP